MKRVRVWSEYDIVRQREERESGEGQAATLATAATLDWTPTSHCGHNTRLRQHSTLTRDKERHEMLKLHSSLSAALSAGDSVCTVYSTVQ